MFFFQKSIVVPWDDAHSANCLTLCWCCFLPPVLLHGGWKHEPVTVSQKAAGWLSRRLLRSAWWYAVIRELTDKEVDLLGYARRVIPKQTQKNRLEWMSWMSCLLWAAVKLKLAGMQVFKSYISFRLHWFYLCLEHERGWIKKDKALGTSIERIICLFDLLFFSLCLMIHHHSSF